MGKSLFSSANEIAGAGSAWDFYGTTDANQSVWMLTDSASGFFLDQNVEALHTAFGSSELTVSVAESGRVVVKLGDVTLVEMAATANNPKQIACEDGSFFVRNGVDAEGNLVVQVSAGEDFAEYTEIPAGEEYTPAAEYVNKELKSEAPGASSGDVPSTPADPVDMTLAEAVAAGELTDPYNLVVDEDESDNPIVPYFSVEEAALVSGIVEGAANSDTLTLGSGAAQYNLVDSVENLFNAGKPVFNGVGTGGEIIAKDSITKFVGDDGIFTGVPSDYLIEGPTGYEVLGEAAGEQFRLGFDGSEGVQWDSSTTYRVKTEDPANVNYIAGGDGADYFSVNPTKNWGGATVDELLIFTGAATENIDGKYEAGADSITGAAAWQENFETNIKAESASPTPSDADFAYYDNANVVSLGETVEAATIVASTAKDVIEFNYQLASDAEIEIHGFEFGTDLLVVRNFYNSGDYFSFNMEKLGTDEGVSIARGNDASEAFVTIDFNKLINALSSEDAATSTATIRLVGLQGDYDFNTNDVGELFGVGVAADVPAA